MTTLGSFVTFCMFSICRRACPVLDNLIDLCVLASDVWTICMNARVNILLNPYATQMRAELVHILRCLSEHGYSISLLVEDILAFQAYNLRDPLALAAREHLEHGAVNICTCLSNHAPTSALISSWAIQNTQIVLRTEAQELTRKEHGLHFRAKAATTEQVEASFMPQLAEKMRRVAPSMWRLVFTLVGALDERRPCLAVDPMDVNLSEVFKESEQSLGDLGGNMIPTGENQDEGEEEGEEEEEEEGEGEGDHDAESRHPRKRPRNDVAAKNLALRIIVSRSTLTITMCTYVLNGRGTRKLSSVSALSSKA